MEQHMQATTGRRSHILPLDRERAWPLDARMAMFVLEAGGADPQSTRDRIEPRQPCRIIGTLRGPDPRSPTHSIVYVRDTAPGYMGFICQSDLPVGSTVWLNCATEDGQSVRTQCHIGRSRAFMQGWNEGVLQLSGES